MLLTVHARMDSEPIMRTVTRLGNERGLELVAGFATGFAVVLSAFTRRFTVMAVLFSVAGEMFGIHTLTSIIDTYTHDTFKGEVQAKKKSHSLLIKKTYSKQNGAKLRKSDKKYESYT